MCVVCTCRGAVSLSLHPPDKGEDIQGAVQGSQLQQDGATDGGPRVHEEGKSGSSVPYQGEGVNGGTSEGQLH